ncbi:dipeptide ABC transporter ATP-binding protein [Nocardia alba]|uniref:Peptide/nickel transport system ATP-binding protein n=1 Tax=Nocardia alba TaxID=225051 RepID=A0A4R1FM31_9NOCA|nr:ABC transporter ATP-binding protein [Nocardia alba]TCJ95633.1 peptide/nickel transport system ATP-binding protein [Nocardia alba]
MSAEKILSVRDLRVSYGGPDVVSGVDFDIGAGEFVALVGESGSGKSTVTNAVTGLLPRQAKITGSIELDGHQLVGLHPRQFTKLRGTSVGLVPQDPALSLNPVLTIGRQVGEVFRLHHRGLGRHEIRRRSIELLDQVGIDRAAQRLRQYPHELSGGLKQRVLIAIAFGLDPRLLIADEPTSALDVTVQKQVLAVFDRLTAEHNTSVLFVTHDLALATDHATQVLVMRGGELLEQGPVAQVVRAPEHRYTGVLLDAAAVHFRDSHTRARDTGTEVLVRATNLVKRFGVRGGGSTSVAAVDDVSFQIRRGTTFSLVGESGSGKSTTARLVLGLVEATSGTVELDGVRQDQRNFRTRREYWRRIQYVYQNPQIALDPRFTVERVIAEPLVEFGIGDRAERRARVVELLEQVGLPVEFVRRRSRDLSGGQQQRVAIARALALGAEVIVLDEALSALDVVTQAQILALLQRLQRELGVTYLFISHDLAVVRQISDDIGVLRRGKLVETGSVADIFDRPRHEYTQELLASIPGRRYGPVLAARDRALVTVGAETAVSA